MLKRHAQIFSTFLRILDIFISFASWELAYRLRFYWIDLPKAPMIPTHDEYLKAAFFVSILTGIIFSFSGVYRLQKLIQPKHELYHLLRGTISLILLSLVAAFFYREFSFSRIHTIYYFTSLIILLFLSRFLTRSSLQFLRNKRIYVENILLIGNGISAKNFCQRIERFNSIGIVLKGFIEIDKRSDSIIPKTIPRLGDLNSLQKTIKTNQIDQVYIALTGTSQKYLPKLKELLSEQWVDVKIVPDLGTFRTLNTEVESIDDMPIVTIIQSPMAGWNKVIKRLMDILGSTFAIILFSPLMLFISFLIKLTSSGTIFYSQERMGLDGLTFNTLKFRSMHKDAESRTGAVWAIENDNRRTKFGIFLRKYSLDELPQLFNVLKGDMSLVGPRPERPIFIEQFKSQIPHYMLRHKVKAGITGWAQINGWRGNTSLEKRIECDLYYIERWSIWLDIKILFLTFFRGFFDPNAY